MSMKKSKFIEIIKKLIEREKKIKEASTSANVPGYMTPNAFSGKGKMDRRNSIASGSGYEKVNEVKFAVTIDLGKELGGEAKVIVDAGSKGAAITMVAKNLRQGRSAVKGAVKVNPALGKKVDTVGETINEDITSSGYSQLKKPLQGATIAVKILNRALKQQNDDKVVSEIEYLYEKAEEMLKIVGDKKYNESINEFKNIFMNEWLSSRKAYFSDSKTGNDFN